MSMPEITEAVDLSDFHVEKNTESCACPAVLYEIYERSSFENVQEKVSHIALDCFCIKVPGLKIDEFSVVLSSLDELLCDKIYPKFGKDAANRFFEEFISHFYPDKKNAFVVKFRENVCIIDNAQNDGESSADFALWGRQFAFNHRNYDPLRAKRHRRAGKLKDYLES